MKKNSAKFINSDFERMVIKTLFGYLNFKFKTYHHSVYKLLLRSSVQSHIDSIITRNKINAAIRKNLCELGDQPLLLSCVFLQVVIL